MPVKRPCLGKKVEDFLKENKALYTFLIENFHLEHSLWKKLLTNYAAQSRLPVLLDEHTAEKAHYIIDQGIFNTENSHADRLIDEYISDWLTYSENSTLTKKRIKILSEKSKSLTSSSLLMLPFVNINAKLKAAERANLGDAIAWLASDEAKVLTDDQMWSIITKENSIDSTYIGSIYDDGLQEKEVNYTSFLLNERAALKEKALLSNLPHVILALVHVKLNTQQQLDVFEKVRKIEGYYLANTYAWVSGKRHYKGFRPYTTLLTTPWCSKALWDKAYQVQSHLQEDNKGIVLEKAGETAYLAAAYIKIKEKPWIDFVTATTAEQLTWFNYIASVYQNKKAHNKIPACALALKETYNFQKVTPAIGKIRSFWFKHYAGLRSETGFSYHTEAILRSFTETRSNVKKISHQDSKKTSNYTGLRKLKNNINTVLNVEEVYEKDKLIVLSSAVCRLNRFLTQHVLTTELNTQAEWELVYTFLQNVSEKVTLNEILSAVKGLN